MKITPRNTLTRRHALQRMAAIAAPLILPSRLFAATPPSEKINIGMIGVGRQARAYNLPQLLGTNGVHIPVVCEVDSWRLNNAKQEVDKHYGNTNCAMAGDWREVIARDDLDAVMISTPDHWHVPIALAAVRAGKHVSCEKPLTLSIHEGRLLADAAREKKVVFRTDSECRSNENMRRAAELVLNGYIGKLTSIDVTVPFGDVAGGDASPMEVPPDLDYEMWTGPAPMLPYTLDRVHPREAYTRPGWMRCRNTCEGMITNWGAHLLDVAQWGHGSDRSGPVAVEGQGKYPDPGSGLWDVLLSFQASFRFADGVEMTYATSDAPYVRFNGEEGWVQSTWFDGGNLKAGLSASNESLLQIALKESDKRLPARGDKEDFIHGIRTGEATMADAEIGHRTCSLGQLAHIAIQLSRKLEWDPAVESFKNDEEANRLCTRSYRAPWAI